MWVRDGVFSSSDPLLSRSEEEVFYLLEDVASFYYHWHLSQHNAQQYRDPLEDQLQALIELHKKFIEDQARFDQVINGDLDMTDSTLSELVQNMMRMDLMIDE